VPAEASKPPAATFASLAVEKTPTAASGNLLQASGNSLPASGNLLPLRSNSLTLRGNSLPASSPQTADIALKAGRPKSGTSYSAGGGSSTQGDQLLLHLKNKVVWKNEVLTPWAQSANSFLLGSMADVLEDLDAKRAASHAQFRADFAKWMRANVLSLFESKKPYAGRKKSKY